MHLLQHISGRRRHHRGVTLIEVVIAFLLLSLTVLMVGATFPSSNRINLRSQQMEIATMQARRKLEEIHQKSYDDLPVAGAVAPAHVEQPFTPSSELPNATGTITYDRVDENMQATTALTGRCLVDVRVNWRGAGDDGQNRQVMLTTLVIEE